MKVNKELTDKIVNHILVAINYLTEEQRKQIIAALDKPAKPLKNYDEYKKSLERVTKYGDNK